MALVKGFLYFLAVVAAIVATVFAYKLIMPEEKGKSENKWIKKLHDLFQFKKLYIEDICKALYIFTTATVICCGAVSILSCILDIFGSAHSIIPDLIKGICMIVFGPIGVRLSYELMMMAILLVNNVIELNKKVK